MNNSVFGKTMENVRNRVNIELVGSEAQARKFISKPRYEDTKIFSENLIAIHVKKKKLVMNKPVYLGMAILDLSKTLMYQFHYGYIKPKYGENANLLFTDTDSLMYLIRTDDVYKDISPNVQDMFDTSEYPVNHPSGIPTGLNKKVLGMFKDKVKGRQFDEFVGLRAKLYTYKMDEGQEAKKKRKGIAKGVAKNNISFDDYKDCLFSRNVRYRSMNIRSYDHDFFTETVYKIALSSKDDKRIVCEDGIHTYAFGHWKKKSGGASISSGTT